MLKSSSLAIFLLASTAALPVFGIEIDTLSIKKEKTKGSQRKNVLTEATIKEHLKEINRSNGEQNCLDCSIEFYKWAVGVNKKPEQAKDVVPETPNFIDYDPETSSESKESSDELEFIELDGFLRKRQDLDRILIPNPTVIDVEKRQEYIDLNAKFETRFLKKHKNDLKTYFDSLPLKKSPCLEGEFSIGIINAFLADKPAIPKGIDCHFFNFYIYQLKNREKKILIVDPSTGEYWNFENYLTTPTASSYDDERFFVWSYTKPGPARLAVKIEENTDPRPLNNARPNNARQILETDGLFISKKKREREADLNHDNVKSQKSNENLSPTTVDRTNNNRQGFSIALNHPGITNNNSFPQMSGQQQQPYGQGALGYPTGNAQPQSNFYGHNPSMSNTNMNNNSFLQMPGQQQQPYGQGALGYPTGNAQPQSTSYGHSPSMSNANMNNTVRPLEAVNDQLSERNGYKAVLDNPGAEASTKAHAQLRLAAMDRLGQGTANGQPNFLEARNGCKAILANSHAEASTKARAQWGLAEMDRLGQGTFNGQPNFLEARKGCQAVLDNPGAEASTKARAQLGLALMNRLRQGTANGQPNFLEARNGCKAILANSHAEASTKALAQWGLANMDRFGEGTANGQPNFLEARNGYKAILDNPGAKASTKAYAQAVLAEMDRLGQGTFNGQRNFPEARNGYKAVLDNPGAEAIIKARAQGGLAEMNRLGQGTVNGQPNFLEARNGCKAILANSHAEASIKAHAQAGLAEMDHFGTGTLNGQPNFLEARNGYKAVLDNPDAEASIKASAQWGLALMNRLGQGTANGQPNFLEARNGYKAVLDNPGAKASTKAYAQAGLAEMDRLGQGVKETITMNREELNQLIQSAIQANDQKWERAYSALNARLQILEKKAKDNA